MKEYIVACDPKDNKNLSLKVRGSIYHSYRWWKIAKLLGFRPWLILCRENGKTIGSFNLYFKKGIFGPHLTGLPFGDFSEPLGLHGTKRDSLLKAATAAKKAETTLSFLSREKFRELPSGWRQQRGLVYFILDTEESYDNIYKGRIHKKTRNMVRKAEKRGIKVTLASRKDLRQFYRLYLKTMRKLGSLPVPEKIFRAVWQIFPETRLQKALYQKKIVGFLWVFLWNRTLWIWANATNEKFLNLGTNYSLYNEAIKLASGTKDIRSINFGISEKDSPQAFFKSRWGGEEKIAYQISNSTQGISKPSLAPIIKHLPLLVVKLMGEIAYRFY